MRDLVSLELSHRIRNIFAVVSGLVALSAWGRPEMQPFARLLQARIDALAAAHACVSPQGPARAVRGLRNRPGPPLRVLTAPYNGERDATFVIEGEDAPIGLRAARALALVVQEFATNAVKYGALSVETGTITVLCRAADGRYTLLWSEKGGPRLSGSPGRVGFGTVFCDSLAASAQIDVQRVWRPKGLLASISAPLEGLDV